MKKINKTHLFKADNKLISVIVPAYKCKTIKYDLQTIEEHLKEISKPYEIICVIDGRVNYRDHTKELAKKAVNKNIRVYSYRYNKGKGYAIRYGMARAKGNIIAFIDAGNDLSVSGIGLAIEHLKWYNADIIIGSKRHKASRVTYPISRKLLSFLVQTATRFIFGINVSDTQTGLKVFKREVLEKVLPRLLVKRWAFDLEVLAVASRLGYKKIYESPVEITYNFASTITKQSVINFVIDYLAIIYRIYFLHYYDDKHQDLWEGDENLKLRYTGQSINHQD
jgi:glycosyltransferase involved in cell wall biosynthesis